jgi:SnoaL-like domain
MTPGRAFYEEQVRLLEANDVATLVETHYTPDAVLLGNNGQDFVVRCRGDRQPLLEHFRNYLAQLGALRIESTDRYIETDGAITFEATVHCERFGRVRVYDAWALRDGKIAIHFTGILPTSSPPEK